MHPGLLAGCPIERYIASLDESNSYGNYRRVTPQIDVDCQQILAVGGEAALELYHKLVLVTLIVNFDSRPSVHRIPEPVRELFGKYFDQVIANLDKKPPGYFLFSNDAFCKDLGVCRQKLVPCGAELVDVKSGVPRSTAFKGGVRQLVRLMWFVTTELHGFKPLFEMHMDPRLLLQFNPAGWQRCYLRIAELLVTHPEILGVCGSSWWFDPALSEVSPRLDFLRKLPLEGGARIFCVGRDEASAQDALANSKQRQDAYDLGVYAPKRYMLIWSRAALVAWAESQRH